MKHFFRAKDYLLRVGTVLLLQRSLPIICNSIGYRGFEVLLKFFSFYGVRIVECLVKKAVRGSLAVFERADCKVFRERWLWSMLRFKTKVGLKQNRIVA